MYNIGDVVSLENEKFIIITKINDNNKDYVFVNQVNDSETEITENYYLLEIINNELKKITDENEVNRLFPKVQEELRNVLKENGIDINLFLEN